MEQNSESEFSDLRQEATRIWDQVAGWWDNQIGKDWTDILIPTGTNFMPDEGGPNAGIVWRNSPDNLGETAYGVGILYEPDPPYGRVLSQSWEFGGFQGDQSDLVQRYIDALRP